MKAKNLEKVVIINSFEAAVPFFSRSFVSVYSLISIYCFCGLEVIGV